MRIFSLDNEIHFDDSHIPVIHICNKGYYSKLISNLNSLCEDREVDEKIVLLENEKILEFSKEVLLLIDIFSFDYNQKKITNKIYKDIEQTYNLEYDKHSTFTDAINKVNTDLDDIIMEYSFELERKENIEIQDYLKLIGLRVQQPLIKTVYERMVSIIDIIAFTELCKLLILVNAKLYLEETELIELYKYARYNRVDLLLIEYGNADYSIDYEKILLIDEDYEEYVIVK